MHCSGAIMGMTHGIARSIEFHRRVREIFISLDKYYPTPVVVVDGRGTVDAVRERVLEVLDRVPG